VYAILVWGVSYATLTFLNALKAKVMEHIQIHAENWIIL